MALDFDLIDFDLLQKEQCTLRTARGVVFEPLFDSCILTRYGSIVQAMQACRDFGTVTCLIIFDDCVHASFERFVDAAKACQFLNGEREQGIVCNKQKLQVAIVGKYLEVKK